MKSTTIIQFLFFILSINYLQATAQKNQFVPPKKSDLRFLIKVPHLNYMAFKPQNKFKDDQFGFNGYGAGLEYYYADKKYIETSVSYALTFFFPVPAPFDASKGKMLSSYYLSATNNTVGSIFTFGYGINYSYNDWLEFTRNFGTSTQATYRKNYTNQSIGLTLNSFVKVYKYINLGIIYRPTFFTNNTFNVEHLISMEANWRFKVVNFRRG